MYKRILVPVDGSPASMRGLNEAIQIARESGGSLKAVHVVNEFVMDALYAPVQYGNTLFEAFREAGAELLDRIKPTLRDSGVPFEATLIETVGGSVAQLILEAARAWQADLIVMGTHGRRGVGRMVIGSDAETVARSATVPVLLVRHTDQS